jgi:quercetin dioxygenase-like cupin family protein
MSTLTQPGPIDFLGTAARILAGGDDDDGRLGLIHMDVPAGHEPPLHLHHREDEGFYVLGGEVTLYLPGRSLTLRAGDFFLAPRGIPHTYETGPEGARVLLTSTPSGLERFVAEVAALEHVDPAALTAVAAKYDIEILGPPGARP